MVFIAAIHLFSIAIAIEVAIPLTQQLMSAGTGADLLTAVAAPPWCAFWQWTARNLLRRDYARSAKLAACCPTSSPCPRSHTNSRPGV